MQGTLHVSIICSSYLYTLWKSLTYHFFWKPSLFPYWTGSFLKSKRIHIHPRKLTCPLKKYYFNRKYIFQPLIFRGHLSFPGSKLSNKSSCRNPAANPQSSLGSSTAARCARRFRAQLSTTKSWGKFPISGWIQRDPRRRFSRKLPENCMNDSRVKYPPMFWKIMISHFEAFTTL